MGFQGGLFSVLSVCRSKVVPAGNVMMGCQFGSVILEWAKRYAAWEGASGGGVGSFCGNHIVRESWGGSSKFLSQEGEGAFQGRVPLWGVIVFDMSKVEVRI